MSNESPFAAPGGDSGTAQAAPAAPQAPQFGAPQFGAPQPNPAQPNAPQFGAPQFGAPAGAYAGVPAAAPPPPRPNRGIAIATIVVSALYVVLCLVEVFALNHRASVANQLINDAGSVTLDEADAADNLVHSVSIVAIVVFFAALILVGIWQRSLRKTFGPSGQYQAVLKDAGYPIFRAAWIVTLVMSVFLRGSGTFDTPQEVVSHDHKAMIYFVIRAALGVLLIFLATRLARVSQRSVTLAQAGYSPAAVNYLSS